MKKFIVLSSGFDNSIIENAKIIKDAGFDGVFLSVEETKETLNDELIQQIYSLGLEIETLHLPYNTPRRLANDLWFNNEFVKDTLNIFKHYIDLASKNNIKTVIMHASAGGDHIPDITYEGFLNFKNIVDYAISKNVLIAFENIKRVECVEYLCNHLKPNTFSTCFDIGHANSFTKNLNTYNWHNIWSHMSCVHLHDNDGIVDLHLLPHMGNIDFKKYLPLLIKYNPNLNMTFELYYKGREKFYLNMDAKQFYSNASKVIDNLLKECLK